MKELKMFIDGQFVENESGKWINVLNPSTEEVISLMPDGTAEDARKASTLPSRHNPLGSAYPLSKERLICEKSLRAFVPEKQN